MLKITVYNTGYSSLLLTFLIGKSSQICYLRFTAENPRGFSRNETIAKHVVLHAKTNNMTDYQQTEEFKRREKESEDVQAILTTWNPLGSRSKEISDLDNYFTEANDILFHIRTNLHFPKKGDRQT